MKDDDVYRYELDGERGLCIGSVFVVLAKVGAKLLGLGDEEDMNDGDFVGNSENDK